MLILEDTDNDGVADKRTVFLQGLDMACGIICGDGGVYIGQQPHLLHFKDNDGDDKPDEWRVVLTGFGREDTHELINSFSWGPDGWLYMTHGVFTNSKVRRPGEPVEKGFKFDAGIGRCKPLTGEFEVFADGTSNPWGCDFDANGNFFVSACVIDHLFHMAPGGIYVRQGGAPENPYAYELLPSIVKHKHFRAAYAGIQIYQGGVYPKDTHGHLFIGNIHDNAIHEEKVTPVGASFKAEPVRDFLRANDGWFRPVSTQTGPDGNLWVMDWCDKYPCYQNAKANPEGVDRARGRVWRVVYTGDKEGDAAKNIGSREKKDLNLKKVERADLVTLLGHTNSWMRRTATRMLVEDWRGEWSHTTIPSPNKWLAPLIKDAKDPSLAITAAWTILSCGDVDSSLIDLLAASPHAALRKWAARLHDEAPESAPRATVSGQPKSGRDELTYRVLDKLAGDESAPVRAATATAIRRSLGLSLCTDRRRDDFQRLMVEDPSQFPVFMGASAHVRRSLPALLEKSAAEDDKVLAFAIWQAMEPMVADSPAVVLEMLEKSAPSSQPVSRTLVYKTMRRLCDTRDAENLNLAVSFCEKIQDNDSLLASAL
ncbi:MAG TPA: PVC-type heme-binding CxxCH protein, partial [Candidatus Saccharimonadia bacterium]|nr:PVC-type heme-binding CxxCH protein [Candidatus Saccharimonadia bacterium]